MEDWSSLYDATPKPVYTKATIKAGLRTPIGASLVWIVVEDVDDRAVYKRFFDTAKTRILLSENDEGKKGCAYVEEIVTDILAEETEPRIFGIRDTDYTRYEDPPHCFPPAIFTTEHRDVEMMMFSAPSVKSALNAENTDLLLKLDEGKPVTRMMGYLRLCNHIYSLGCNFKRKVKISKVWNDSTHSLVANWKEQLLELFVKSCNTPFSEELFNQTVEDKKLEEEDYLDICQGHDTLRLLQYMMISTQKYNETYIMACMTNAYSSDDFKQTGLYQAILNWSQEKGVSIFVI